MRYLRKHYKDPLNCKNGKCADFRLLHYGEPGVTLGGGFSIGGGSIPGASAIGSPAGQNGFGGSSSSFGNSGFGGSGNSSFGGSGSSGSGFGNSGFGNSGVNSSGVFSQSSGSGGNSNGGFGSRLQLADRRGSTGRRSAGNECRFGIRFVSGGRAGRHELRRPATRRQRPDRRRGQPLQENHHSRIQPQEEV